MIDDDTAKTRGLTDREEVVRQALGATDATTFNGGVQDLDQRAREVVAALDADRGDEQQGDDDAWEHDEPGVVRVEVAREDGMRAEVKLGLQVADVDDPDRLGVALAAAVQAVIGGFYLGRDDDAVDAHQAAAAALSRSLA